MINTPAIFADFDVGEPLLKQTTRGIRRLVEPQRHHVAGACGGPPTLHKASGELRRMAQCQRSATNGGVGVTLRDDEAV